MITGFFTLTRLAVTPVVSLSVLSAFFVLEMLASILFNKEKELIKDSREKDKNTLSFRNSMLTLANSQSAGEIIIYSLLLLGTFLPFIGVAPALYRTVFLGISIAILIALALVLTITVPTTKLLSEAISSLRRSVKETWENRPRNQDKNGKQKKKSSEPEEATFIGIND